MFPLTVEQICQLTGGIAAGRVPSRAVVDNVVIDSRQARPGSAFVALQGSRAHGCDFAEAAVAQGACVVIVDGERGADDSLPRVLVPDAAAALTQIAVRNRRQSEALTIGITGSVGKTTTRRMICSVLDEGFRGVQSPGNFNNRLGVPLSLLQLSANDEFAVIELAASAPGEIADLAKIVRPDFAVVTRVAPAHLDGFGSLKSVQEEKSELVRSLTSNGVAFLNADDPRVQGMAGLTRARTVSFGESSNADVRAQDVRVCNQSLSLVVDSQTYVAPVCGRHHVTSVLATVAVGRELGLTADQINQGLSRYQPEAGRCRVLSIGSLSVIDDTYNASPASVAAAAEVLQKWSTPKRRLLVLGDMLDLGDQAEEFHYSVGASLAGSSIDHVLSFGRHAADIADGFLEAAGSLNRISVFADFATLLLMLDCLLSPGDVVLVKGSRGMQMERVIAALHDAALPSSTIDLPRSPSLPMPARADDTYIARRA